MIETKGRWELCEEQVRKDRGMGVGVDRRKGRREELRERRYIEDLSVILGYSEF
jgi:hypothetical protein